LHEFGVVGLSSGREKVITPGIVNPTSRKIGETWGTPLLGLGKTKGTPRRAPRFLLDKISLCAGSGSQSLGRLVLGLVLLLMSLAFAADLDSTLKRCAIFHSDANGRNIAAH